jgi:hypothetical protein
VRAGCKRHESIAQYLRPMFCRFQPGLIGSGYRRERARTDGLCQMTSEQIRKSYEMPLRKGFTVTHFITVADMDRFVRFKAA